MNSIRKSIFIVLLSALVLMPIPHKEAKAGIVVIEIIRQGIIWVIKAVNLMVMRLQNETLWLQNAQKWLENKLSELKLDEIGEWTERQRQLYGKYYDDLWKVRSTLETYNKISVIVQRQQQIIDQYRFTWHMVSQDDHFTTSEIDYMYRVYTGILNESVRNVEQVLLVINAYRTQMSDAKRLEVINKAAQGIEKNYTDLQQFNNENIQLSIQRAKDKREVESIRKLYGLPIQ